MNSNVSRRGFVITAALGIAGAACSPGSAFASVARDAGDPIVKVEVTSSDGLRGAESCQARIIGQVTEFDQATMSGSSDVFIEVCAPATRATTSKKYSDVVAEIQVSATWTMNSSGTKVKLTKAGVNFKQKMGTITGRGFGVRNTDHQHRKTNAPLSYSYSPSWGYQVYYPGHESTCHYVNAWGKATPSGMGGSTDVSCTLYFGGSN